MPFTDGSFKGRAGSKEYVSWQVRTKTGDPANLSNVESAVLAMINRKTRATKLFALSDVVQQFFITDEANGYVEFRPKEDDFPGAAQFMFCIKFIENGGKEFTVPRGKNYYYQLISNIE